MKALDSILRAFLLDGYKGIDAIDERLLRKHGLLQPTPFLGHNGIYYLSPWEWTRLDLEWRQLARDCK